MVKKITYSSKNKIFLFALLFTLLFCFFLINLSGPLEVFAEGGGANNYSIELEDGKDSTQEVQYTGEAISFEGLIVYFDGAEVEDFEVHGITVEYYLEDNIVYSPTNVGVYNIKIFVEGTIISDSIYILKIIPKKIEVQVSILGFYIYDGSEIKANVNIVPSSVGIEVLDIRYKEDLLQEELDSDSFPQKAGVYSLDFFISDNNYSINKINYANGINKILIKKAILHVKTNDLTLSFGEKNAIPTYIISGYAPGENEDHIDEKPTINADWLQEKSGIYRIKFSGAAAENYDFDYEEGILTINAPQISAAITGSDNSIEILGNFSPNCKIKFTKVSLQDKDVIKSKTAFAERDMSKFNDKLLLVFNVNKTEGSYDLNKNFKMSIDNIVVNNLFKDSVKIIVVDKDLKPTLVSSYTLKQGELSFEVAPFEGYVFIYVERLFVSLAIAVAGVVVFLILVFLVIAKIKYENTKKEIEENKKAKDFEWTNKNR